MNITAGEGIKGRMGHQPGAYGRRGNAAGCGNGESSWIVFSTRDWPIWTRARVIASKNKARNLTSGPWVDPVCRILKKTVKALIVSVALMAALCGRSNRLREPTSDGR